MHLLGVRLCPPYANSNRPQCLLRVICVDFGMSAACPVRVESRRPIESQAYGLHHF